MFIFEDVDQVSGHYHSGGGLAVVSENEETARVLISKDSQIQLTETDWKYAIVYELTQDAKEWIHVFPDAGCC